MSEVQNAATGTNAAKLMLEDYSAKITNIAKENMQFAFDFGQALSAVRTPAEWFDVTTQYSKKRFDAFQRHTKQLMHSESRL